MNLLTLLNEDRIRTAVNTRSKKRVLEVLSETLAAHTPDHTHDEIFNQLITRERLGSTGLGNGVALPHCRLIGLKAPLAALITLVDGIDFDAPDNLPVDLIVCLVVPEGDDNIHLDILSNIATLFSKTELCEQLRHPGSPKETLQLLHHWQQHIAA